MRIFVTGATGFIGDAVVRELLGAGHQVLGLARSDRSAEALKSAGAEVHRGDLTDLDSLTAAARATDGTIQLAFIHDFTQYMAAIETDRRAVEAIAQALEGTGKPFLNTSGLLVQRSGPVGTESDPPFEQGRGGTENVVLDAASRNVRSMVIRLAASVHGAGDQGFVPFLIGQARKNGFSAYIGEGQNRWPAVYREDAARLYRLALENGKPGARFHGVGEEGITMRAIADEIGKGLKLPVRSLSQEEAPQYLEWMARFASADLAASSAVTQQTLGWQPAGPGLVADMHQHYFG